jgi:hypothetical protein
LGWSLFQSGLIPAVYLDDEMLPGEIIVFTISVYGGTYPPYNAVAQDELSP